MPIRYPIEVKARAKSLYCESGMSFDEVGAELGIAVSTLKGWGEEDGGWAGTRVEYERSFLEMQEKVQKLRLKVINDALDLAGSGSQDVIAKTNALKNIEQSLAARIKHLPQRDTPTLFVDFVGKFIDYLKSRDGEALRYLEPHLRGFAETMKQAEAA